MKRILSGALLLSVLAYGSISTFAERNNYNQYIGEESAKIIALNDAGLRASDVSFVRVKLDKDNGRYEYDIEFYVGNTEYDYEIDATTGRILEKDYDIENYKIPNNNNQNQNIISEAKAKEIALKDAGLKENQVSFVRVKLDRDDGRYEYNVEFYSGNTEYDYEIDAVTGRILERDLDIENYRIPNNNNNWGYYYEDDDDYDYDYDYDDYYDDDDYDDDDED